MPAIDDDETDPTDGDTDDDGLDNGNEVVDLETRVSRVGTDVHRRLHSLNDVEQCGVLHERVGR